MNAADVITLVYAGYLLAAVGFYGAMMRLAQPDPGSESGAFLAVHRKAA